MYVGLVVLDIGYTGDDISVVRVLYHQSGTLQIAPLHVLSHFAANVGPQGLPQTFTITAIQKDKVRLLQMSKFEASKDFPNHIIHIELRLPPEISSKLI